MAVVVPTAQLARLRVITTDVQALVGTPTPLLKRWGVLVQQEIDRNFQAGGRPPWVPLRPSTIAARRKGSDKPLRNTGALQRSFDHELGPRHVTVFSRSPVAVFHEFGTRGPYPIVPKKAGGWLAIPIGNKTLAGLGRSVRLKAGGFIFRPAAGQKIPKRFARRVGKTVLPFADVIDPVTLKPVRGLIFRRGVMHPGLPARPMFPTLALLVPRMIEAGDALIRKLVERRRA